MKFLAYTHANPLIQGSGGEKCLQGFLESLAKKKNKVYCLCSNENKQWKKTKFEDVFYLHEDEITLEEMVEKLKPGFIITQFFNSEKAIKIAHDNGIKVIYLIHNDFEVSTGRELKLLKSSDYAVFNTVWIGKKMFTQAMKFVIHPILKTKDVESTRQYVTLINPTKNKGSQIFYSLAINNKKMQFLTVGGGYGIQHNVNMDNVTHIGNTQNIFDDVYAKTRVLMMPSLYESYGMCAAEAAYCGIPVICSKSAGFRECLGESGIYVNSLKWTDWNKKLLMLNDNEIYKKYSKAVKRHSEEDINKNYFEKFYEVLIRRK